MLFSLVVLELLDDVGPFSDSSLQMWFLDDSTSVGPRTTIASFLNRT